MAESRGLGDVYKRQKSTDKAAQVNNVAAGMSLGDLGVLADLKKKLEGDDK